MNAIARALRGILGLFFDDGSLAFVILGLLVITAYARHAGLIGDGLAMGALVGGPVAALFENVIRFAGAKSR